jgi:acyl carrier protein
VIDTMSTIEARVLDIIDDFTEITRRDAALHLHWMDRAELALTLESEFGIEIDPDAIRTINDIIEAVQCGLN